MPYLKPHNRAGMLIIEPRRPKPQYCLVFDRLDFDSPQGTAIRFRTATIPSSLK